MKIILSNISKKFRSNKVINNFNYSFNKGTYAILGKNGSGKSTLLKIIGNLLTPSSGKVIYDFSKSSDITKEIFFCAPYQELISELTVSEFLNFHKKFRDIKTDFSNVLKEFKLNHFKDDKIHNLSSGSIQKLKLIISFYSNARFILLDEPTTNLDDEGKIIYLENLNKAYNKKGIIIATNDKNDILEKKTKIINIDQEI